MLRSSKDRANEIVFVFVRESEFRPGRTCRPAEQARRCKPKFYAAVRVIGFGR
jgi:hypothetical protein